MRSKPFIFQCGHPGPLPFTVSGLLPPLVRSFNSLSAFIRPQLQLCRKWSSRLTFLPVCLMKSFRPLKFSSSVTTSSGKYPHLPRVVPLRLPQWQLYHTGFWWHLSAFSIQVHSVIHVSIYQSVWQARPYAKPQGCRHECLRNTLISRAYFVLENQNLKLLMCNV